MVSAVCTTTACNHGNSRKMENRNIHGYYGFLWVWFIDRHVFSELYVIYNFLDFPRTPQLFCHNSIICSEQNPVNYGSARAFGAQAAVRRSIKKHKGAWVIARVLLLMPSPPHAPVQGVVDGNQTQWQAYLPFQHPCHNPMMWLYPLLLCSLKHTNIFNMPALFIFGYFASCDCDYLSNTFQKFAFIAQYSSPHNLQEVLPVMVCGFPLQSLVQYHSRAESAWSGGQGSSQKLFLVWGT